MTTRPATAPEPPSPSTSLADYVRASGLQSLVVGLSRDPNAKVTILLVEPASGRPALAVKAPTTDAAEAAVVSEWRALTAHADALSPQLRATIPEIADVVDFEGRRAIVMTAVDGAPMTIRYMRRGHTASAAGVAADFEAAGGWLAELQRQTAGAAAPLDMDGAVSARLRLRFAGDPELGADLDQLAGIHAALRRHHVARTAVHGDFWFGNVLVDGARAAGVVDWESGLATGEPARDLVRFAVMYALYLDRRTGAGRAVRGHAGLRAGEWGAALEFAVDGAGWFPEQLRAFVGDGLRRMGASPQCWRDAMLAGIAEVAALTDHPDFAHRHLELFRRLTRASRREGAGVALGRAA